MDLTNSNISIDLAAAIERQGNLDGAIEIYRKAIEIDPNSYQAYNSLGNIFYKQYELENVMKAYQKAISMNSNNQIAYYNLGLCYERKKQWMSAV